MDKKTFIKTDGFPQSVNDFSRRRKKERRRKKKEVSFIPFLPPFFMMQSHSIMKLITTAVINI